MIGARGTDGKAGAGLAPRADGILVAGLLGAGLLLCGARALGRRADLAGAGSVPDPAVLVHRVDLSAAGEAELQLLPGVGPRLAGRIAAARAAGGPFASLDDVDRRVAGVGPVRVRRWRGRVEDPREGER